MFFGDIVIVRVHSQGLRRIANHFRDIRQRRKSSQHQKSLTCCLSASTPQSQQTNRSRAARSPHIQGTARNIQAFQKLDIDIGLGCILDRIAPEPEFDLPYSEEIEARLPVIAGGSSLAVARTFKIIDPQIKHPATEAWERAFQIFNLLL